MLKKLDSGMCDDNILDILNTPDKDEDIISACDKLIISLENAIANAYEAIEVIKEIKQMLLVEFSIYVVYCIVSMITLFPAAMLIWRVRIIGSLPAFLGSWLLTMVSTLSIGMMVGGVAKTSKSASVIACVLYFPMLIFSGATLPFEVMPPVMQKIVSVFPLTQGIGLMESAFLGLETENVWIPIAVMAAVTVICTGIAVKFFRWE